MATANNLFAGEHSKESLDSLDNKTLLEICKYTEDKAEELNKQLGILKYIILKRMITDNASMMQHGRLRCKIKYQPPKYENHKLHPLFEILDPDLLKDAYTPAHEELIQVAEKWDGRKLRALLKHGEAVAEIINNAKLPSAPSDIEIEVIEK